MKLNVLSAASIFFLQILLIQSCTATAGKEKAAAYTMPEIKKDCALCHLSDDAKKATALLKKPVSELCVECHQDRKAPAEHKVDVVPSFKVEKLPLTDGKVTCVSCHDPHANPYGKMLRVPSKDLCVLCHNY